MSQIICNSRSICTFSLSVASLWTSDNSEGSLICPIPRRVGFLLSGSGSAETETENVCRKRPNQQNNETERLPVKNAHGQKFRSKDKKSYKWTIAPAWAVEIKFLFQQARGHNTPLGRQHAHKLSLREGVRVNGGSWIWNPCDKLTRTISVRSRSSHNFWTRNPTETLEPPELLAWTEKKNSFRNTRLLVYLIATQTNSHPRALAAIVLKQFSVRFTDSSAIMHCVPLSTRDIYWTAFVSRWVQIHFWGSALTRNAFLLQILVRLLRTLTRSALFCEHLHPCLHPVINPGVNPSLILDCVQRQLSTAN